MTCEFFTAVQLLVTVSVGIHPATNLIVPTILQVTSPAGRFFITTPVPFVGFRYVEYRYLSQAEQHLHGITSGINIWPDIGRVKPGLPAIRVLALSRELAGFTTTGGGHVRHRVPGQTPRQITARSPY